MWYNISKMSFDTIAQIITNIVGIIYKNIKHRRQVIVQVRFVLKVPTGHKLREQMIRIDVHYKEGPRPIELEKIGFKLIDGSNLELRHFLQNRPRLEIESKKSFYLTMRELTTKLAAKNFPTISEVSWVKDTNNRCYTGKISESVRQKLNE